MIDGAVIAENVVPSFASRACRLGVALEGEAVGNQSAMLPEQES